MKASVWVLALLVALSCVGCQSMRGSEQYEGYRAETEQTYDSYGKYLLMTCKDALWDLTDIFRFHVV